MTILAANAAAVIICGNVPNRDLVVQRAGKPVGQHLPVVGTLFRGGSATTHYAGAGRIDGDVVHFAADAWREKPVAAYERAAMMALDHADRQAWVDDVIRRLPAELHEHAAQ